MFEEKVIIPDFKSRTAVYSRDPDDRPPCIGQDYYMWASCFGLLWVYRLWFHFFSSKHHFTLKKKYFISADQATTAAISLRSSQGEDQGEGEGQDNKGFEIEDVEAAPVSFAVLWAKRTEQKQRKTNQNLAKNFCG